MKRFFGIFALLFALFAAFALPVHAAPELRIFRIYQINCGKEGTNDIGDAYLFLSPDGKCTLLDGGTKADYARALRPALDRLGIRKIDQVVISHLHFDHCGALLMLMRDPDIAAVGKVLWQSNYDWDLAKQSEGLFSAHRVLFWEIKKEARNQKIPFVELKTGDVIDFGAGATGKILFGCTGSRIKTNYMNNQSLVFRFVYGENSIFFCGDMGFEEEKELMASGAELKSDVLKAPHHGGGGASSEELLRQVAPKFAIVPIPKFLSNDPRGQKTAERYARCGIPMFRAWEHPELRLETNGREFTVWDGEKRLLPEN